MLHSSSRNLKNVGKRRARLDGQRKEVTEFVRMSSAAADRAFNLEAWLELEAFAFAAVEGRIQAKLARQELEHIKDESVAALFKADALLLPCIAAGH
jgi:hypothetical protein